MKCIALFLNWVLHGQSSQYVLVYNFTNMYAMSHRSDFFACSSRVDIYKPAICWTITWLLAVTRVVLSSFLIPTAMSNSQSLNTSMLEVVISAKNERVIIQDLSDHTLQIVLNAWRASINVDSKRLIARNNSRNTSSWRFYLHCEIEETVSPRIICIICHQVLCHPSEHGTAEWGNISLQKLTSQS